MGTIKLASAVARLRVILVSQGLDGSGGREIIPHIQRLLAEKRAQGTIAIFLCDNHAPDDLEFRMFPPHCIRGTEEADVVPELRAYTDVVIPKRRYSGFFGTDLDQRLQLLRPDTITVVGVCTDICVLHTVADARNRDYSVVVPKDCVATFDKEAHRFALQHMERILGAKVV